MRSKLTWGDGDACFAWLGGNRENGKNRTLLLDGATVKFIPPPAKTVRFLLLSRHLEALSNNLSPYDWVS